MVLQCLGVGEGGGRGKVADNVGTCSGRGDRGGSGARRRRRHGRVEEAEASRRRRHGPGVAGANERGDAIRLLFDWLSFRHKCTLVSVFLFIKGIYVLYSKVYECIRT
jgi:hypothetical protein